MQCREVFDQMVAIIYTEKMHQNVCLADGPVGKNQTTIRLMNHTAGAAMFTGVRCSQLGAPISRCHSSFIINGAKKLAYALNNLETLNPNWRNRRTRNS